MASVGNQPERNRRLTLYPLCLHQESREASIATSRFCLCWSHSGLGLSSSPSAAFAASLTRTQRATMTAISYEDTGLLIQSPLYRLRKATTSCQVNDL